MIWIVFLSSAVAAESYTQKDGIPWWESFDFWRIAVPVVIGLIAATVIKIFVDTKLDRIKRNRDSQILAAEIHAELESILRWLLRRIIWAKEHIENDNWEDFIKKIGSGKHQFLITEKPVVIEANLGKLGLLPKDICADVVRIYKYFNSLNYFAERLFDNTKETHTSVDTLYRG